MSNVETKVTQELPESILATLAEIGEEINASLNLDRVLSKTATLIKRLIDYEIFSVMLLDERTQTLSYRFAMGYSQEILNDWRMPVGQGISGSAAASREPVLVADVRNDPRYINAIDSVRSELAVPLLFKNQVIGVLDIQSTKVDYFTHEQQEILVLLASRLAMAIENARLFERARSQAETLLLLNEVGREASSILDVEVLLRRAARAGQARDRLPDHEHHALRPGHRILSAASGGEVRPERAGQAARRVWRRHHRRGGLQRIAGARSGRHAGAALRHGESGDALGTGDSHDPQGRVVGVLDLESPQLNYFTEDHVQALSILAAQLAVAWKTRASTRRWRATKPAWSANCTPRSACRARCCGPFPPTISAWIWPREFFPRAKSAAIFTISCATAPRAWALAWATSAAKVPPPRCMAPWPSAFCAAWRRRSCCPRNCCAS